MKFDNACIKIHVPAIPGYLRNLEWNYKQISDALHSANLSTRRKMAFYDDITTRSFTLSQRFNKYGLSGRSFPKY